MFTAQRSAVLQKVQQLRHPVTNAELADLLGLHPNTVREHLEALVERGYLHRSHVLPQGRGRPAWTYVAVEERSEPDVRIREYMSLAGALAEHLSQTSDTPEKDAQSVGTLWAHSVTTARPKSAQDTSLPSDVSYVLGHITDLGFAPAVVGRAPAWDVDLCQCPLLEIARCYPDVVCQVHLGLINETLRHWGSDRRAHLQPFSKTGACSLLFHDDSPDQDGIRDASRVAEL